MAAEVWNLQPTPPEALARLAKWLSNDDPPWAAYSALMAGRLIAIDKNPGFRPISLGEVLRRLIARVYSMWPKEKRKKLAELISSVEDCKQA